MIPAKNAVLMPGPFPDKVRSPGYNWKEREHLKKWSRFLEENQNRCIFPNIIQRVNFKRENSSLATGRNYIIKAEHIHKIFFLFFFAIVI